MVQVGSCFLQRGNAKLLRHVARAQALELGEDKPHPVAPLAALPQLGANALIDGILGDHEALEVEGISRGQERALQRITIARSVATTASSRRARPASKVLFQPAGVAG